MGAGLLMRDPLGGRGEGASCEEEKESGAVSANQLERHMEDQLPVGFGHPPEKLAQPLKKSRGFAGAAPLIPFGRGVFREGRNFGRRFAVVEELVHRNFEGAGHLFKRLDARDGVAVLHTRDVATLQASALLNVPLREIFLLADSA